MPQVIFESPKKVMGGFLQGLFETDGTVDPEVSITTKDPELAEDLILLLASFGIRANRYAQHSKKYKKDYYKVSFGVASSRIFENEIGFISNRKKEKLYKLNHKKFARTKGSYASKWETEIKQVEQLEAIELMDLTIEDDHTLSLIHI